jgi:hypothetical protein
MLLLPRMEPAAMLNEFTSLLKGLVPASGGGTKNFLRADGTWADPNSATAPGLKMKVGVVSYFYPGSSWDTVNARGATIGYTIMNPASGPGYGATYESGGSVHTDYSAQVAETQGFGIPVLHYLSQNYRDNASEHGGDQYAGTVAGTYLITVNTSTNVVTTSGSHGRTAGTVFGPVQLKEWPDSGNTLPGGLAASTNYWARATSTSACTLHDTEAHASANTNIVDITSSGTGTGFYMGLSKSLDNIQNVFDEIDLVLARYPTINGFFFDETRVTDNADSISYVKQIFDYIKAINEDLIVVQNGYQPPESFVAYADTFMRYENTTAAYLSYTAPAWMANYPRTKWWDCAHTGSTGQEDDVVAKAVANGAGFISFHSSSFSGLPAAFGAFCDDVDAVAATPVADELPSYGSLYWSVPASTTLAAATPAKFAGTTVAGALSNFTMPSNNRLKYTGTSTVVVRVDLNLSVKKGAGSSSVLQIPLYKNGAVVANKLITLTGTDYQDVGLTWFVPMSTNDYIESWGQTDTGDDVTVYGGTMVVQAA